MKIRNGFVSNSSSSSFAIWGACLDYDDLKNVIKTFDENIQESLNEGNDCITNYWSPGGNLVMYEDYESQIVYIGKDWSSIGDDETGKQFKEKITKEISELLGKEIECSSIETEIHS